MDPFAGPASPRVCRCELPQWACCTGAAVLVSSLSAGGDARTDLALARVCQGVRLGDPVRPTLVLFGTLARLGGHWRDANRHDVCATFGAPDVIYHVARGRDVWFLPRGYRN